MAATVAYNVSTLNNSTGMSSSKSSIVAASCRKLAMKQVKGLTSCTPCPRSTLLGSSVHYSSSCTSQVNMLRPVFKCNAGNHAGAPPLQCPQASANGATAVADGQGAMPNMEGDKRIKEIVILGGGTAGWMTAAYLGKALQGTATITVLESPQIPKLGVGEATIPHFQTIFFDFLEIPEEEWMREVNASYKIALRFTNWCTPGEGSPEPRKFGNTTDYFYHQFRQVPWHDGLPLSHYWFRKFFKGETDLTFSRACFHEALAMDLNKSPNWMDGTPSTTYAWHFDAHLVADYLRRHATTKLGVQHIQDQMDRVELKPNNGYIHALHTVSGRELHADLFVDCSGFRGLLINKALEEPFLDMSDHLLCNSAVASAVPHDDAANGIEPYSTAIAMKSGWTWKIPMLGRFGAGYVYSSEFCKPDEAAEDFCRLWGLNVDTAPLNKIKFRVGMNRRAWVGNCIAIGTSSCFLEPLESTGIYFIYAALYKLMRHFPDKDFNPTLIDRFNKEIETLFNVPRDFIQAHYYYSLRNDTPFWRACKELTLGPGITERLKAYRAGLVIDPPADYAYAYSNSSEDFRTFLTNSNYYCILSGFGILPDAPLSCLNHMPNSIRTAELTLQRLQQRAQQNALTLPSCYDYLCKLHGRQSVSDKAAVEISKS